MFKKIKKKILPQKKDKGEDKKIPQEILDKLPPGMKIKRIEIGPGNLIRWALSLLLMYMAVVRNCWNRKIKNTVFIFWICR